LDFGGFPVNFDNPIVLCALILIVPLAFHAFFHYRKRRIILGFFSPSRHGTGFREIRFRYILSTFFFLLFTASLIVSLAGPRWGIRFVPEYRRGLDVVLVMDLSRSMDVRDAAEGEGGRPGPSRLERAAAIAGELAALSRGVRFAAVVGKGTGFLAVPLTDDVEAVAAFLEGLSTSLVTGRGTNLESLVNAAFGAFQSGFPSRKSVILFSDGEALQGSLSRGIEKALDADISITAVGLGSESGGPVPSVSLNAALAAISGAGMDAGSGEAAGLPEMSFLRRDILQNAAERTGGIYIDGNLEHAAALLSDHIATVSPELTGSGPAGFRRERVSRAYIFIIIALIAFGISRACGKKRKGRFPLLFLCVLFISCSDVPGKLKVVEGSFFNHQGMYAEAIAAYRASLGFTEAAPYGEYGLAVMYLALDEGEAALGRLDAAEEALADLTGEEHRALRYGIHYNRGVIRFQNEDYAGAAGDFRKALETDSSHIEAKRNLELSLLSMNRPDAPVPPADAANSEQGGDALDDIFLFEYLRNKEQDRWKSREWVEDTDVSGPDY
jgi:Ca-activated chloride channel family protein